MKKTLILTLLFLLAASSYVSARTTYDSRGHILVDDTIRGQRRAAQERLEKQKKAAAAAKVDYEAVLNKLDNEVDKTTNYQNSDVNKTKYSK